MIARRIPLTEEPISGTETVDRYDKYSSRFIMPEYKYFVRKILALGIRKGRVLDIGTGNGRLAIELAKAPNCNFEITGLDISPTMLAKARENAREAGLGNQVQFVLGTAAELPFRDGCFDLVISYASLHHWQQPTAVFNEAYRVTKENGNLIIRDNRRVIGNPFWDACIWTLSRFMSKPERKLWPNSILASYTIPEVKQILSQSQIPNYRVGLDYVRFDICIEAQRK